MTYIFVSSCMKNFNSDTRLSGVGVSNESDIDLIYKHFYHGMDRNLTDHEKEVIIKLSESEVSKINNKYYFCNLLSSVFYWNFHHYS